MENKENYLVVDNIETPEQSLQVLYMLAQKANKAGVLDLNESSQVHGALVFYTKLVQLLSKKDEKKDDSIQLNS